MKDTELAYLAGIIDGEGFITINHRNRNNYAISVGVGNTEKMLLEWLRANFGGKLVECPKPNGYKTFYQWAIWHQSASDFLQSLLPYLKLKKGQAELAVQFHTAKHKRQIGAWHRPRTTEETAYEEACHILMSSMNRKGNHTPTNDNGNPVPSLSKEHRSRQEGVETRDEKLYQ